MIKLLKFEELQPGDIVLIEDIDESTSMLTTIVEIDANDHSFIISKTGLNYNPEGDLIVKIGSNKDKKTPCLRMGTDDVDLMVTMLGGEFNDQLN